MKSTKIAVIFLCIIVILTAFVSCGGNDLEKPEPEYVTLDEITDAVQIHTELQQDYLNDEYDTVLHYASGSGELSKPRRLTVKWKFDSEGSGLTADKYILRYGEKSDLSDADEIEVTDTEADIVNLKIGTEYYVEVTAVCGEKEYKSMLKSFTTDSTAPRNIDCGGVTNFRDLGGWKTVDGGEVRQGLIYRCARLNENYSFTRLITDEGRQVFNKLGIKTEVDLRRTDDKEDGGVGQSFVNGVNFVNCPMSYTGDNLISENHEQINKFFEILSDESNYPIVFHCSIGTDRTGMMAYLIEGLLGVSYDDSCRDYLFSNFGHIYGSRGISKIKTYEAVVNRYNGDTRAERIYNMLSGEPCSDGTVLTDMPCVPAEQLDSVIRILKQI